MSGDVAPDVSDPGMNPEPFPSLVPRHHTFTLPQVSDALLAKQKDHQLQEDTEIDIADVDAEAAAALAAGEEEAEEGEEEEDELALEAAVDEGGGATAKGVPHAQPKGSRGPGGRGSTAAGSGVAAPAPAAATVESGAGDAGGSGGKRTSGRANKAATGGEPAGKRARK